MYETINSPINYGGLELKNRIIFAPTTFGLSDDAYFEKIRKIAAGGCAMIIIGDVPVGKSQFEKSLFDKKGSHIIRNWLRLSIAITVAYRTGSRRDNCPSLSSGRNSKCCRG